MSQYFLDIGNTRVKAWACDAGGHVLSSQAFTHAGDPAQALDQLSADFLPEPGFVGVASVLGGDAQPALAAACAQRWRVPVRFAVSQASTAGVRNGYREPERLGVDRWLGVLAVADGQHDYCVVDCGTAMTIDAVTRDRVHLGGYILPGLSLLADALVQNTRQVRVSVSGEGNLGWGRHTSAAVLHGALLAATGSIRLAHEQLASESGRRPCLVLTGGDANRIAPLLALPHVIRPDLLLTGLQRYFFNDDIKQSVNFSAKEAD